MSVYETSITNPKKQLEFYKDLSEQLEKENQELKILNKRYKEIITDNKENYELFSSEIKTLKTQQKEFIEWLKQNIENEEYCYLSQNPSERCRKDVFEEVLSKHKEIVGE